MAADGSIIIDTKIDDDGMSKGFQRIKSDMGGVAREAEKIGNTIKTSFAGADFSKPVAKAQAQINSLQRQFEAVSAQFKIAVSDGDDKAAERLDNKRMMLYERLEAAREKLAIEVEAAARRQAEAEESAARKEVSAMEKRTKSTGKQLNSLTKGMGRFGTRLRSIVAGALVFNIISSGLRGVTKYFGSALKANETFSNAFAKLRGALLTAFQPIYEVVVPALTAMVNMLTRAAVAVGRFFAALTGKSYGQMAENAENLYNTANGIEAVGGAAKKTQKILSGLDEVNTFNSEDGGGGGGTSVDTDFAIGGDIQDNISPKIQAVIDTITKMLQPLREIDFSPAQAAFQRLGTAVLSFGKALSNALGSAWYNILVPLATWTIEEAAPALIHALAAELDLLGSVLEPVQKGLGDLFKWLSPVFDFIGGAAIAALEAIQGMFSEVAGVFREKGEKIREIISMVGEVISKLFEIIKPIFAGIIDAFLSLFRSVDGIISSVIDILHGLLDFVLGVFTSDWRRAWSGIKETFVGIWDLIKGVASGLNGFFSNVWSGIKTGAINAWTNIQNKLLSVWNNIKTGASNIWSNIVTVIKKPINAIIGAINGMISGVVSGINTVIRALNRLSFTIPSWVPAYGGRSFGFNISTLTAPQIPYLAQGAVIPPNAPFTAVLGDQRHGKNLEAPESLIRQIIREETAGNRSGDYRFVAQINRRTIFDEVIEEAKLRRDQNGNNPFLLA